MNRLLIILGLISLVACKKNIAEPVDTSWQKGKIKTIEYYNSDGDLTVTNFTYELVLPDSIVLVKEKITKNASKKMNEKLVFIRDAKKKLIGANRTFSLGDSSVNTPRKYNYNNLGQLEFYADSLSKQLYGMGYQYHPDGKLKMIYEYKIINNAVKIANSYEYKWTNANIETMVDRNGTYEETDYLYDKIENPLFILYSKYIGEIGGTIEFLTPLRIAAYQEMFKGTRYKYTYENDGKGVLINIILSKFSNGNYIPIGKRVLTYY